MERDKTIDILRGIMMLYIVYVVHAFGIMEIVPYNSILFSLLLFEMPIVFFVSGASLKLSTDKSFGDFAISRIKRIVIPYVTWAAIALLLFYAIKIGSLKAIVLNLLLFKDYHPIPFTWHMWFIVPYLIISLMGYFLIKAYHKWRHVFVVLYALFIAGIILVLDVTKMYIPCEYNLRYTLVYSAFYVMGFIYNDDIKKSIIWIAFGAVTLFYLALLLLHMYPIYTQVNKFPPNFAFLCYGTIAVLILLLLMSSIKTTKHRKMPIVDFANKCSFEMYLYQNYSLWLCSWLLATYFARLPHFVQIVCVMLITTGILFPVSWGMNKIDMKLCELSNYIWTKNKR